MNDLYLEFDLSRAEDINQDPDDLRRELAGQLNVVLKKAGQGQWVANKVKGNLLQVKCSAHDPDLARAQIKYALSEHWIIKYLLPEY